MAALEIPGVGNRRRRSRGAVRRWRSNDMVRLLARYTASSFPHRLIREKRGEKLEARRKDNTNNIFPNRTSYQGLTRIREESVICSTKCLFKNPSRILIERCVLNAIKDSSLKKVVTSFDLSLV